MLHTTTYLVERQCCILFVDRLLRSTGRMQRIMHWRRRSQPSTDALFKLLPVHVQRLVPKRVVAVTLVHLLVLAVWALLGWFVPRHASIVLVRAAILADRRLIGRTLRTGPTCIAMSLLCLWLVLLGLLLLGLLLL